MKKSNRSIRREGFTLVELLIVIVVIGILSAMMMLSSTEAVSSAKANNIVSNLRNLKTAALSWYIDSIDSLPSSGLGNFGADNNKYMAYVKKYLSNSNASDIADYQIGEYGSKWYLLYKGSDASNTSVLNKLNSRRQSVGLLKNDRTDATLTKDGVCILVR